MGGSASRGAAQGGGAGGRRAHRGAALSRPSAWQQRGGPWLIVQQKVDEPAARDKVDSIGGDRDEHRNRRAVIAAAATTPTAFVADYLVVLLR